MPIEAPQRHSISTNETRIVSVDFKGKLDTGELLTGTPTVAEVTTGDLTLGSKQVNTVALTINNRSVAIGEAVMFTVALAESAVTDGDEYRIDIICSTDAGQTVDGRVVIEVV